MKYDHVILTCEHASNRVPAAYAGLFRSARARAWLETHRGYDIGAAALARALAQKLAAPLECGRATRLLVELNRSLGHRQLFSEFTRSCGEEEKRRILARYYEPYRLGVTACILSWILRGHSVLHLSVHSFTPRLHGETRHTDVGLLYHPAYPLERSFCAQWRAALRHIAPALRVRYNYPYRGASDSFTTSLRRCFEPRPYLGIELEVNQAALQDPAPARVLTRQIAESLWRLLQP